MKIVLDDHDEGTADNRNDSAPSPETSNLPVQRDALPPKKNSFPVLLIAGIATLLVVSAVVAIFIVPKMSDSAQSQQEQQVDEEFLTKASLELTPGMTWAELDATAQRKMDSETYKAFVSAYENAQLMTEFSMFNGIELDNETKMVYLPANSTLLETVTADNAEDVMRALYRETEEIFDGYDNGFNPVGFMYARQKAARIEKEGVSEDLKTLFSDVLDNNRAYEKDDAMCIISMHDFDAANNPARGSYFGYYQNQEGDIVFVSEDEVNGYVKYDTDVISPDGTLDGDAIMLLQEDMQEHPADYADKGTSDDEGWYSNEDSERTAFSEE